MSVAAQNPRLLQELGRRLQARGVHGDVKLVGGAALFLQGIGNRPTPDIDASYADKFAVPAAMTASGTAVRVLVAARDHMTAERRATLNALIAMVRVVGLGIDTEDS